MSDSAKSYDELPYPSFARHSAHPDEICAMAWLHGVDVADPAHARVLEIGCSDAGHTAWVAHTLPGAEVVGIDVSPRQIDDARAFASAAGLANLELRCLDLLDLPTDLGRFDVIISHGVFSWVPEPVRVALVRAFARHLAPRGVGFLSFNTLPGWYPRLALRDCLRRRVRDIEGAAAQAAAARAHVNFLATGLSADAREEAYGRAVLAEQELLARMSEAYVFHELLEGVNEPLHYSDVAGLAGAHGLRMLCRSEPFKSGLARYPASHRAHLASLDPVTREQTMDELSGTRFREQLLVRDDVEAGETLDPLRLHRCHVSERLETFDDPRGPGRKSFRSPSGHVFSTADPVVQRALGHMTAAWPFSVPVADVLADVPADRAGEVAGILTDLAASTLVRVGLVPFRSGTVVPALPRLRRFTRAQLESGRSLTTLRGQEIVPDPLIRGMLALLDGTRELGQLVEDVARHAEGLGVEFEQEGRRIREPAATRAHLARMLPDTLAAFLRDDFIEP